MVGVETQLNPAMHVAEPPGVVSTTSQIPSAFAGVITVTDLALTLVIVFPAVPPNITNDVSVKLVPVIVAVVPPPIGPFDGATPVMVGVET